ncbi:phytanoyl-CoA dioxygenase family protein [Candidatus Binatia bacterium]|nr:phytanoyl-CoA dioxygenase family protein [Candidatus Binatia bacterium]
MFEDVRAYGKADLAGTHRSTAGTQAAADPALLDRLLGDVRRQGFVLVPDVVPIERIEAIRTDVLQRLDARVGRNNFEGLATRRLYAVIAKTMVCNELVEHPLVLGLLDRLLEPNYLLSQLQVIDILPGESAQPLHPDDGFYAWPRPRPALGVATIWPLDDFTAENGATVVVPGSHLWDDRMPTDEERAAAVPAVMPRGSVLLFLGTLWHGGGANRSDRARACVTAQYCAPWCRQQENFALSVPRERVRQCSEHVQRLLGYSIHPPFMGFVDGMHPKRLLQDAAGDDA